MSIKEKIISIRQKNKEWHERFRNEHPKLADAIIKLQACLFVGGTLGGMYLLGYSDGSKLSPKAMQENFEKSSEEVNKLNQQWLDEQRKQYLEHFSDGQYAENAAEFIKFAENFNLQPGESYFLWDENQFKGENRPVDIYVNHQVYGISDPSFDEPGDESWGK